MAFQVPDAAPSLGRQGVVKDDRKTVFARNLPFRATEADLEAFFSQAGRVVDVRRGLNADGAAPLRGRSSATL
jgi:RNA recognition motif-containing protein